MVMEKINFHCVLLITKTGEVSEPNIQMEKIYKVKL